MCGGSTSYGPPPRFTHYARTMEEPFPSILENLAEETLQCAFPDVFEALVISLFVHDGGYTGHTDDAYEPSPGNWYGISWGIIHYQGYYLWQHPARQVRMMLWKHCWNWIISFGNVAPLTPSERKMVGLAFDLYFPVSHFAKAVRRLVRLGMLRMELEEFGEDKDVEMYYPTKKLAAHVAHVHHNIL